MSDAKYIVGNWKMHGDMQANAARLQALLEGYREGANLMVCVPYPYLWQARQTLKGSPVAWGAQNLSEHPAGAFTGEVSAAMLRDFECRSVIVGHSERRSLYGESDTVVAHKAQAACAAGLEPIICVGETLDQREQGETAAVVLRQLDAVLTAVAADIRPQLVVAYEPVWAIGSGRAASPGDIAEVHRILRERLKEAGAPRARLLYGGSVKASNAGELLNVANVDGALVGGASLDAEAFLAIAQAAQAN